MVRSVFRRLFSRDHEPEDLENIDQLNQHCRQRSTELVTRHINHVFNDLYTHFEVRYGTSNSGPPRQTRNQHNPAPLPSGAQGLASLPYPAPSGPSYDLSQLRYASPFPPHTQQIPDPARRQRADYTPHIPVTTNRASPNNRATYNKRVPQRRARRARSRYESDPDRPQIIQSSQAPSGWQQDRLQVPQTPLIPSLPARVDFETQGNFTNHPALRQAPESRTEAAPELPNSANVHFNRRVLVERGDLTHAGDQNPIYSSPEPQRRTTQSRDSLPELLGEYPSIPGAQRIIRTPASPTGALNQESQKSRLDFLPEHFENLGPIEHSEAGDGPESIDSVSILAEEEDARRTEEYLQGIARHTRGLISPGGPGSSSLDQALWVLDYYMAMHEAKMIIPLSSDTLQNLRRRLNRLSTRIAKERRPHDMQRVFSDVAPIVKRWVATVNTRRREDWGTSLPPSTIEKRTFRMPLPPSQQNSSENHDASPQALGHSTVLTQPSTDRGSLASLTHNDNHNEDKTDSRVKAPQQLKDHFPRSLRWIIAITLEFVTDKLKALYEPSKPFEMQATPMLTAEREDIQNLPTATLTIQAHADALAALRKESLDIYNRLHSIEEDISFVNRVNDHYPDFPLLPNLRCGAWYTDPALANETPAYFKSTDGHTGNWGFNLRRANLHLLPLISEKAGIVLVDSTRAGKRMPDALSKTVPIWCAVINRAILIRRQKHEAEPCSPTDWDTKLYTPPGVGSSFELPLDISAPLRPFWITPSTTTFPALNSKTCAAAFLPIICVSASKQVEAGTERRVGGYAYVQGSGDDHELWGMGLTPRLFWRHREELIACPRSSLEKLINQLLSSTDLSPATSDANTLLRDLSPTPIRKTNGQILIASFSPSDFDSLVSSLRSEPPEGGNTAYVILDFSSSPVDPRTCSQVPGALVSSNTPPRHILHVLASAKGKARPDAHFLQHILPTTVPFIKSHLFSDTPREICILEGRGNDPGTRLDTSVALAVVAIQLFFDQNGALMKESQKTQADKQSIRTRLEWVIERVPRANPSRATLKRVNEFLLIEKRTPE
ncbi:hypothetical protein NP233_g5029 [Leucocoprinus birnbaumii]|uniref:Initiator tRNA phosphoribosyl transferase n=1 Tax=Leucocoprinus birnbaumii TaxID=56174 RepID=A0AAD5VTP3_9AGAR|nr:hypothetical protein NP233_g5029 [Leucocoprinus birnbaumii]